MKNNNKNKKENANLDCGQEFDCCSNNQRVEFGREFDSNHERLNKEKKKHNKNLSSASSRTNAYAQGTEYSNELGTTRSGVDINNPHDNERYATANHDRLMDLSNNNSPYNYANDFKYEIGDESYLSDVSNYRVDTHDFDDLENARKSYFERLNNKDKANK